MRLFDDLHREKFKDHIEYELVQSGYQKQIGSYDKDLFDPRRPHRFHQGHPTWQFRKLENQYGPQTEEKLLKRISDEIEKRGLIDVL